MSVDGANAQVLVIDDEPQIRRLLRFTLENAGYVVHEADTGHQGLVAMAHGHPDAIILDLGLPDIGGLEVLRRLREWSQIPVLILSVLGQEGSKIAGFDAGADDYLTKPFGGGELLARLRTMLRRAKAAVTVNPVRFGAIEVEFSGRRVTKNGVNVKLTVKEYALLHLLVVHRDKVLTHGQILREVWGADAVGQTHYLRVFMMRLRRKLEDDPDVPKHIQTEPGIGYRLVSAAE